MSFLETVEQARAFLERNGRVSVRALKREFELDDDALEELVEELVEIQQVAAREGKAIAWVGPAASRSSIPESPGEARAPRDYTPKHLADKILQSKSALEGERKQVTVLFADVKGSMELAEQLDPEVWHGILERFFETLAEGIHRFEGTVNQYTGDGIMALFGAPIAHEDHAQRACYAALWLRDSLQACALAVKREHGLGLTTRIGLHSGEVVVGKIGDDLRMDYTAQGHTVGLAQRMESLAEPNTCYLSETAAKLVSGYFELGDLGAFPVKGVSEPITVFQLRGLGALQTRFDVSRARGLSRFVGRDSDMQTLDVALEQARNGNGQVVGIVAEAGTGKSRLCFEFLEGCRARGMTVLEGRAVAHGKDIPLLPMLQVFRAYYGITDRDDDRTVREKIAGRLLLLDPEFAEFLPVLFELFGAPDPERPVARMDPEAKQRQIFAVIRRIVQGTDPKIGQTVVLIEDLHWMDSVSETFLERWVEAVAGSSFLLLVNFRPEYGAGWMSKSYYRQIPLAPLGPDAVRELLDDLLGRDPSIEGLAEAIHGRTGGNPFFTEEVVQNLIESGNLEGTKGSYRLVTPIERLEVPATVRALLSARIDRLAEREKAVLQAAAVIGKEFAEPVLLAASEYSPDDVRGAIRTHKEAEFVYEQSLYPVPEYAFKHPLTQEVALGSQLQERRRRTHAAVAKALEEENVDRLEETAALLAHHWEEAGEDRAAARWHRSAAEWAGMNDVEAALTHWRRVRELSDGPDPDAEAARLGSIACSQILALSWRLGLSEEEGARLFEEGRALAQKAGDLPSLASLTANYAGFRGIALARGLDYVRNSRDAARIADETGDLALRCGTRAYVVYAYRHAGEVEPCIEACLEIEALADGDPHLGADVAGFSPLIGARSLRLELEGYRSQPPEGDARAEFASLRQLALDQGYPEMVVWLLWEQTLMERALGCEEGVMARAREALGLAEGQSVNSQNLARLILCLALGFEGDARAQLENAEDLVKTLREAFASASLMSQALQIAAEAHLSLGQPEDAHRLAAEATARMAETDIYGWSLSAYGTLARAQLELGEPAEAVQRTLAEYAAAIERTGMRVHERELEELRGRP